MANPESRDDWVTGRLLSTAARLVEQTWNARLRAHGVSHAGLVVLSTLARGPASQRELALDQHVTEQTIGRTLAHLEATGHVRRSPDRTDRRRRTVELTAAGAGLFESMSGDAEAITDEVLRAAGADIATFRATLESLITGLDPDRARPAPAAEAAGRSG